MKSTITIIVLLALAYLGITIGYDRGMVVHCNTLLTQSEEYQNFEISKLDYSECKEVYGIEIKAPIK